MELSLTFYIAAILAVSLSAALVILSRSRSASERLVGPPGLPLIGNLHQIRVKYYHLDIVKWARQYGPNFEFSLLGNRCVAISDPELAKKILWARPHGFARTRTVSAAFHKYGVLGVFSFEGEQWKRHRRLISPAFSKVAISKMHHAIEVPLERLIRKIQNAVDSAPNQTLIMQDPRSEMASFTLDVILYLAMGYDLNSLEQGSGALTDALSDYFNHMSTQLIPSVSQILKEKFVPNWDSKVQAARKVVMEFIDQLVTQNRREVDEEQRGVISGGRSNLLKELIRTVEEDDAFTDDELRGEVLTIMGAGLDTTSILLSWSLVMLCKNPQYHAILRREVLEVVGESALPSMDHLPKLIKINNFLQETLRMHAPAPLNGGDALEPFNVDGVEYPAGTRVFLLASHIIDNSLSDPEVFSPERYEQPSDNPNEGFINTLPFGGGPRICPGRQLALVEAASGLAALVRSFDFELVGPEPEEVFNFTVGPSAFKIAVSNAAPMSL